MQTYLPKILLVLLLNLPASIAVDGQISAPVIELNSNRSGSTWNFAARDEIKMRPGFVFSSSSNNSLTARIDAGLLFPPTEATYKDTEGNLSNDPTRGAVVGSIPGEFAVSPTGAATYTIPIEVPAGINGMQPSVSLVYNSQVGDGIVGWGWNLNGISMISRVPKNHYYDNDRTGIIWDNTSPYALDGQRLIKIQSWGNDSVEYDTESQSGNRIVGYEIQSWGPAFFKVYTKSGQCITYGNPDNLASYFPVEKITSSTTGINQFCHLGWAISDITDNNQNTIKYFYTHDVYETSSTGECIEWIEDPLVGMICDEYDQILNIKYSNNVLEKITYGGNSAQGKEDNIQLLFQYHTINPSSVVQKFVQGKEITVNKKLYSISSMIGGTVTHSYITNYYLSENKYRITNVQFTNSSNGQIKSSVFDWSNNQYQYNFIKKSFYYSTSLIDTLRNNGYNDGFLRTKKFYGDIDGDGDLDMLTHYILLKVTPRSWPWTDKKEYKHLWVMYRNDNGVYIKLFEELYKTTEDRGYRDPREFIFLDKDNDGKDELYIGNKSDGKYKFTCFKLTDTSFGAYTNGDFFMPANVNYLNEEYNIQIIPGDFLGKGEPQFLSVYKTANKIVPFSLSYPVIINSISDNVRSILVTDINGNGKAEIACIYDTYIGFYELIKLNSGAFAFTSICFFAISANNRVLPADLNGDGCTDLIVQANTTKQWSYYLSTGLTLVYKDVIPYLPEKASNGPIYYDFGGSYAIDMPIPIQIADINKDGKSDILFLERNANGDMELKLLVNDGTSFSLKGNFTQVFSVFSPNDFIHTGRFAGVSGSDKYDDIVLLDFFGLNDPIISVSKDVNFDKIVKIINPLGSTTHIVYDVFNSEKIKVFENSLSISSADDMRNCSYISKGSWDVVSETYPTDHINNEISRLKYYYGEAVIHKEGKGSLGYKSFAVHNTVNSIREDRKFRLNEDYFVLIPETSVTLRHNTTDTISITRFSYNFEARGNVNVPKYYSWTLSEQVSKDYLSSLVSKVEYLSYDSWLNPLQIKTTKGGLIETQTISYTQKGSWCPNKPDSVIVVTAYEGQSETRKINYEYNNKGTLIKEILHPNSADYRVTTEYKDFNSFGQAQTIEVKAKDAGGIERIRRSSLTYTPSGRFVATRTNVLNETTSYAWDELRGLLDSETSRGQTTYYTYDSFGRLQETRYPDATRQTEVLQWAGGGGPAGAVYYRYTQTSGSAPLITWFDALGREVRQDTYGLYNRHTRKIISVSTEYYTSGPDKGRLFRVSEPYFEGDVPVWATTYNVYNNYGRPTTITTPLGPATYSYNGLSTTVTTPSETKTTTLNPSGFVASSTVNGKTVSYTYYPSGMTKTASPQGGQILSMEYNLQGKRTRLTDPDAGIIETKYNGFGELVEEKQKVHSDNLIVTSYYFEPTTGRLKSIDRNGEITSYDYDIQNRIGSIELAGRHKQEFTYDQHDRVTNIREEINGMAFNRSKEYDALGRIKKDIYPSGYYTVNVYDKDYGFPTDVRDKDGRVLWQIVRENARGQLTEVQRGGKITKFGFDNKGMPTDIKASGIVNLSYDFGNDGNLNNRIDSIMGQEEEFVYDGMNRLTHWNIYQNNVLVKPNSMVYNATTGTISTKSDLDNFTMNYGENGKPHALTSIEGMPTDFPTAGLNVTYTDFKKIKTLTEGNTHYVLTYGVDDQRRKSEYKINGVTQKTKYYLGDYEEERDNLGNTKKIHYLSGGAILVNTNGVATLYYGYTDYQGNLMAIANESGTVVERYAYDPWGKRRNPADWTQDDTRTSWIIDRGYTMHEHLDAFGIINMNGRVYDPLTAQFFSPDPFVQAPGNWLNYNRYSYCFNNPLKYTDLTGEFIFTALLPGAGVFIDAALWGAVIGGAGYTANVAFSDGGFNNWNWGQFGKSVGFGAASGVLTAGIGQAFGAVGSNGIIGEVGRAVSHGVANGMMTGIQGGDFMTGFAAGGLSSLAGSAFMMYGGKFANSNLGIYTFSALAGGVGAELTGGNFWQGAATGLMTAGLNHAQQGLNKLIYNKTFNRIGYVPLDEEVGYQMANYKMRLRIWQNGDDQLSMMAETFNTPVDGDVVASADARLMVNNKQVAAQALSLKRNYIYPTGGLNPIGEAYFQMPTSGNVSINFRGGWTVYMPGGAAVPIYHPIGYPVSININQRIVIR